MNVLASVFYKAKAGVAGSTARATKKHRNGPMYARQKGGINVESALTQRQSQQAPTHSAPPQPDNNPVSTHPFT